MTRTVNLVIVGAHPAAAAAAIESARRGMRVLVVMRSRRTGVAGRLRRALRAAGESVRRQVTVLTGAEVVCVDGVHSVEAVVIRRVQTGRLIAVNASAISPPALHPER
jgi:thioredoxin reductase